MPRFETKGGVSSSPMTGLLGYFVGRSGASGFGASSTAEQVARGWDGAGKTVLITGANTGARAPHGAVRMQAMQPHVAGRRRRRPRRGTHVTAQRSARSSSSSRAAPPLSSTAAPHTTASLLLLATSSQPPPPGLGLECARVLTARGAEVVIAARDQAKGAAAVATIKVCVHMHVCGPALHV